MSMACAQGHVDLAGQHHLDQIAPPDGRQRVGDHGLEGRRRDERGSMRDGAGPVGPPLVGRAGRAGGEPRAEPRPATEGRSAPVRRRPR